ncbi:hypothetical protein NGM37_31785, partial [Streptomyces sp. TRM76130]|nr:hypothetical protein [Streptomyces sp. TRM76130]
MRVSLFSELYLRYVQEGLRPYLIVSGAVLVLLAAVSVFARRPPGEHEGCAEPGPADDDGHGHSHGAAGPRVAWLLTLPAVALLLFPPPALGTYSAEREAAQRAAQGVGTFPALPSGDPVELTLAE